jgi:hypothetical protein
MEPLYEDPIFLFFLISVGFFILVAIAIIIYKTYWYFGRKTSAQDVANDLEDIAYKKE